MKFFDRKNQDLIPVCKICGLEFSETERMVRHMLKAHSKPCKNNSCGCS